ncbi:MAG: M6 family metalloprotease domain-containing protein [Candidatus Cloacimonadaceae bacterium]|nr:M6 family metalloprotease domain-containing protein [Candidatus Cloacimonadota bacterium]
MRYSILILIMTLAVLAAAPHSYLPLSFEQPDGSIVELYASGDEFHNWLHDKDNYSIVQNDAGWYVYARQNGEDVAPTDLIAGRDLPQERALTPGINLSPAKIAQRYERMASMRDYGNGRSPHIGQFNNLVVFIRFADDPEFNGGISYYDAMFNDGSTNANSMKNYFHAASYDQLTVDSFFYPEPNGNIIVSYVDSHPRNYYRKLTMANPIGYNEDDYWDRTDREHTLLANASTFVASQIPLSLDIDGDDDGYVDNVCFIIQGSPDGWADLLWPHRWTLYGADAFINGAQVWDFNFQLENSLSSSGASVLSHEMFHSLGAPDLYRYDDTTITPIGSWDLMASNSNPPQHMSAWMKYRYGQWLPEPPLITESGTYTLHPVASSSTNNIYRINSWNSSQSYILEYRKPHGIYDDTLPGQGLLVYRLDTREEGNASGPPDELYIYRRGSNNTTTNGLLSMAHFSAQQNRTQINESTVPSGFLGNNAAGGLNVYNVGFAGDTISFTVRISDVQLIEPIGGETWFSGTNKQIRWKHKSNQGTVNIHYSMDGGQNWVLIVEGAQNSGAYTWSDIPNLDSENCYIRITLGSNGHFDENLQPFNIIGSLDLPQTIFPADLANDVPTNPLLDWQDVNGATGYYLQMADNQDFEPSLLSLVDHPQSQYQASGLDPHSTYYWRVASIGEIGASEFTPTLQFTTGDISESPATPVLISPGNFASNLPSNTQFTWSPSYLAESYHLQIATDPYFINLAEDALDIPSGFFESSNLEQSTQYYWRVAAVNSFSSSNFTPSRRFSTGAFVANEDELLPVVKNSLHQNHPNPFNPHTQISFSLKEPQQMLNLKVFNTRGQLIRQLYSGKAWGNQMTLTWDGKDDHGNAMSSGIYLYRLETADFVQTRKMLLSK